ncbi:MAG: hypothetical protein C0506_02865 [Anaerolinea sp.]|nr:hypothetical protein [Anaerolinea sp.]
MSVLRGVIAAWSSPTATIRLEGSAPQTITTTKVSLDAVASMAAGRKVLLDTGDHNDPADFVIFAVWA